MDGWLRYRRSDVQTGFQIAGPADRKEVVIDRYERETTCEGGFCICLNCHTRVPYLDGITCLGRNCPECGAIMVLEGSPYHLSALRRGSAFDETSLVPTGRAGEKPRRTGPPVALGQGA